MRLGRVYPRACGGTELDTYATAIPVGLSPRVRGNQLLSSCEYRVSRSIPARAGEPYGSSG